LRDLGFSEEQDEVLDFFRPKISPRPLVRIGGDGDGAYLVPEDFKGVTDCFSPGVAESKTFEDDLLLHHGIHSHLLDLSADPDSLSTLFLKGFQTFEPKWLGPQTEGDFLSLGDWVQAKADPSGDLILQVDIEGGEFDVFQSLSPDLLRRFRIIVVELHWVPSLLGSKDGVREVLTPLVKKLGRDFVTVHAHANNCCGERIPNGMNVFLPNIFELTLLRKDRFPAADVNRDFLAMTPHPLDIRKNTVSKPHLAFESGPGSPRQRFHSLSRSLWHFCEDLFDPRVSNIALVLSLRAYVRWRKRSRTVLDLLYKRIYVRFFRVPLSLDRGDS